MNCVSKQVSKQVSVALFVEEQTKAWITKA